ncbi:rhodanese-related sulfurtransferase [Thiogranum longum]|uniref:Rhodanese-related sulfurtransferase n=1 Tax=Thiogranum longum TaxID=1537524 RepID=A0A4R1H6R8_9GAMM|nr:rhodanese-like domain-containing protein [Thiogranum longum]TCK16848.1 rhodanese-related sulfurtransferase [Thiogranum longum]
MDFARILEFSGNHPVLILAFLGALGLLIFLEAGRRFSGMKSVGPIEAIQLNNREDAVFLDIRDEAEYRKGHIPDAIHIPLKQLPERVKELEKYRGNPVIACCRSGNRSTAAGSILAKHGFENVYNLDGGISAWQSANLPVNKK